MATQAIAGYGIQLQVDDDGTGTVFTTIAEVRDITGPQISSNVVDVTPHSAPGGWRERIITLNDGGTIAFPVNLVPGHATHDANTGLLSLLANRSKRVFRIIFPDTTQWDIPGYVHQFNVTGPVENQLAADVSITATGQPTFS